MKRTQIIALSILIILFNTTLNFAIEGLRSIKIVAKDGEVLEPFGQSWAVVVGIDDYQKVGKLKYAVNDAKAVKQMLQDKYGFAEDHIFTLYDNKATKSGILQMLGDELPYKIGERDRLLVYFAGHGESSLDNGYLIPVDFRQGEYRSSAISMTELKDILKDIKAKHIYMVLDACYSGMFFTTRAAAVKDDHPRYLQEITKRKARQALTAGGKEPVSDGGYKNHSAFTGTFLEALSTGIADYNGDGIITASEINAYIQPKVAEIAEQTPEFGSLPGSEGGEFVFISPSDSQPEQTSLKLEEELKVQKDKLKQMELQEKDINEKQKAESLRLEIAAIEKETREKEKSINFGKDKIKQIESQQKENSGLVAYYPFNGNADDESGNGNNGTVYGATLTTDRFGNENSAYNFNGMDNYINYGKNSFAIGNANSGHTWSMWIKPLSVPTGISNGRGQTLFIVADQTPCEDVYLGFGSEYSSQNRMAFLADGQGLCDERDRTPVTSKKNFVNGQWYYITAVMDYPNKLQKLYINGVLESSKTSTAAPLSGESMITLGSWFDGSLMMSYFNGTIDDVRIYNYALSDSEINDLYNNEKSGGLVAYYPFNGNANDESGNGNNGVVHGATLTTDRFGNENSAYSFNGKDDYISVADNAVLNPKNITISAWIKLSDTKDYKFIIQKYNPNYYNQGYAMAVNLSGVANQPAMWVGGNKWTIGTFVWDTNWHHITGIYDDSMVRVYIDGRQIVSQAQAADLSYPVSLYIGTYNGTTGTYNFSGLIDDVRIYNRVLSDSEILGMVKVMK
ncbi:MAG: caspase family protein [bacterium]|nr:caspase family protein [bacterium]